MTSPSEPPQWPEADLPLRVSTLELFFDLVFVFTITQLTGLLASDVTFAAADGCYIPMLLGVVAIAAALKTAVGDPGSTLAAGPGVALAGGVA